MPVRFANERIANMVKYIETPHVERPTGRGDTYFYGQSGEQWRKEQDQLHKDIQDRSVDNSGIRDELKQDWGLGDKEINMIMNHRGRSPRHVYVGVPQARTSEEVAKRALEASGIQTNFAHGSNPLDTDLSVMVGNVHKLMDVQNRMIVPNQKEIATIPVLNNLQSGLAQEVFRDASGTDSLRNIISEIRRRDPRGGLDKFLHSEQTSKLLDSRGQPMIRPGMVKDYMIGGGFTKPTNVYGERPAQGSYDPQPVSDLHVQDWTKLRDTLGGMTKRDFLHPRQVGGDILRQEPKKLKLRIPLDVVKEISKPDSEFISREVLETMNYLARG